jgi:RNA polymerase sigma-70 factor (ECF subfamily)
MDRMEHVRWMAREVLPHEADVRRWLARRIRGLSGVDLDDTVQEAYARLAAVDPERIVDPRAYFFVTAGHVVGQAIRRSRVVPIETMADIDTLNVAGNEFDPERRLSGREEIERFRKALAKLPPKCRQAFELRKFEELSQRQIAERMGVAESTVEKHLSKALRTIMAAMQAGEHTPRASLVRLDDLRRNRR